ncbi:MAG: bile acid:sodium symporter family protein [Acidobacteriota bacterium]|nr:MAG: bile acid:sodium symporter family protein [Acidobacteriota bacterium]
MTRILKIISNGLAPLTLLAAVAAYLHPPIFLPFSGSFLWFFAATMLALGVVLDPAEFVDTFKKPREIGLGLATQYSVMPILGFVAAYFSGLDPELALGFVIVGCAPGAMASNVIVYLAGGAVAYSVALTSIATFLSPLVTPSLVELLGGVFLPIPFWPMMNTILLTVLFPLVIGMALRRVLGSSLKRAREIAPAVAVTAIVIIIGYAVAANQEQIARVGGAVFALVVLVNALGYLIGWFLAALYRFERSYQLALMIEIGMQNAGLGVALALQHFSPETALPGVLFATWCILTAAGATAFLRRR